MSSLPRLFGSFTAPRPGLGGRLVGGGTELSPLPGPPALSRLVHRLLADALRADASLASRYRCPACQQEHRPVLELLGVEAGRISGSLAPAGGVAAGGGAYELAARLAWLSFGVQVSPMAVWRTGIA